MFIDADTHIFPTESINAYRDLGLLSHMEGKRTWKPTMWDMKVRHAAMKDAGFQKQVLIAEPSFLIYPQMKMKEASIQLLQKYNNAISKIQKADSDFVGCAEVPFFDVDEAIAEARRCVNDLGFKAIRIAETWLGENIESQEWWPFFEVVQELDVPLWYHGVASFEEFTKSKSVIAEEHLEKMAWVTDSSGKKLPIWRGSNNMLGQALGAFFVVSGMVMSGLLKKYPHLNVVITEAGVSLFPFVAERLDKIDYYAPAHRAEDHITFRPISTKPSEYVKKHFWFGIDYVGDPLVPILVRDFDMGNRMMVTTDFPHASGDQNVIRWIEKLDIPELDKEKICGGNAADLLKI